MGTIGYMHFYPKFGEYEDNLLVGVSGLAALGWVGVNINLTIVIKNIFLQNIHTLRIYVYLEC